MNNHEKIVFDTTIEHENEEFDVTVKASYFYDPGSLYGPPEKCYPKEEVTEILSVTRIGSTEEIDISDSIKDNLEEEVRQRIRDW